MNGGNATKYMNKKYRILSVNIGNYGSTGKIIDGIREICEREGYECYTAYRSNDRNKQRKKGDILIGWKFYNKVSEKLSYYTGLTSCFSIISTIIFVAKVMSIKPDIIHLHNIHPDYLNIGIFFNFLKKQDYKIVWTLHDCWSFTGRCPHFQITNCDKWVTGCSKCPYPKQDYPESMFDRTKYLWNKKRRLFTGFNNLVIVTPSIWLSGLVGASFLKAYPMKIINNGIDLSIFQPFRNGSKNKYNINGKYVILGVSSDWCYKKGLDVFIELRDRLSDEYSIVLVGTTSEIDALLPEKIISIHRTNNQRELAELYSLADVFLNPTREDTFPTVNIEALACGTPVVTYKTGGSPEIINEKTGKCVESCSIDEACSYIIDICENGKINTGQCVEHAKKYDMNDRFREYLKIYEELLNG